jgi:hypothetical protein
MIFGQNFKYKIPEMDALLGAAADMGIHFSDGFETVSYPSGKKFVVQIATVRLGETVILINLTKTEPAIREDAE